MTAADLQTLKNAPDAELGPITGTLRGGDIGRMSLGAGTWTGYSGTYVRLAAVRQQVGEALSKKQGPFKDIATGELKRLYGALADDQQQTANFYALGDLYRNANELVQQRKVLEKDLIKVIGKDLSGAITSKAGLGGRKLSKGDYKTLDQVLQRVPADMRKEIVISALNDAFVQGSRKEMQLNIPGFVDWYEGL